MGVVHQRQLEAPDHHGEGAAQPESDKRMSAEHADSSWTVRVHPHGFEFDCCDGENVMAALADHIPTIVPTPRGAPSVHLSPV